MNSNKIYDTAVIGSGASGMTAALALAKKGKSVLLLEADKSLGGMLNPFQRKRHFFDVGIHYIGECGPQGALKRILDSLGVGLEFNELNPDGFDRYIFPEYEGMLCKGLDTWLDRLCSQFPKEASNLRKFGEFMLATESIMRMSWRGFQLGEFAKVARFPTDMVRLIAQPYGKLLSHYFEDRSLVNILSGPGGDLGLGPGQVSAFSSILLLMHYLKGAYYPKGGTKAYKEAYVKALEAKGVEAKTKSVVAEIRCAGGRFTVVTEKEEAFESKTVISAIDAVDTANLLRGATPNWIMRKRVTKVKSSLGSICVFLGLDMDLSKSKMTDANIWHYGSEDIDACYGTLLRGEFPETPNFFVTAPTLKDPGSGKAPEGHNTLEIIAMAPLKPFEKWLGTKTLKRGEEYDEYKESIAAPMIEEVQKRYIPGLSDHIVVKEIATPLTNISYVRARDGGIYGPAQTPDQSFLRRFFPNTGIDGLYLAGASVLGAGVMPCTMSGILAARKAMKG